MHRQWLAGNGLIFVGFPPEKMATYEQIELSGESGGEYALYWSTEMEAMHEEEGMIPLGQSTLGHLEMGLLHKAVSEVMG